MNNQAVEREAEYQAMAMLVQVGVRRLGEGVYSAPSESESAPHVLTVNEQDQVTYCTCRDWKLYRRCYHGLAVSRFSEAEAAIQAAEAIVAEPVQPEFQVVKVHSLYYPQHFENGEWLYCVDRPTTGVNTGLIGTRKFGTEEQAWDYLTDPDGYASAMTRRMAWIAARDAQNHQVEAPVVTTEIAPELEYIRMRDGALVRRSDQRRYRHRGTFNLYR